MATCGSCGGSGGHWETFYDKNGIANQKWVLCNSCGGSGQR